MKKILVIAAHPDDEVLGCGGTIARHREENDQVHIILMADGVTSRTYDPDVKESREEELKLHKDLIVHRQNEVLMAAGILGVAKENIHLFNFPDQRLDTVPLLDLTKRIEKIKAQLNPEIVYTHFWNDLNMDHCLTARATLTAFRPVNGVQLTSVYHFEVLESTSLSMGQGADMFQPNHFVDITGLLEKKIKALAAYDSEKREYPDLRSAQYVKEHAQKRSIGNQGEFTEAFYINHISSLNMSENQITDEIIF